MTSDSIVVSALIPASPMRIYQAWLSSEEHAAFTGSPAHIDDRIGSAFTAADGYITGTNRDLVEGKRIVQSWRTTEFPADAPDSLVDISFEYDKQSGGTEVTLVHDEIPEGQGEQYAHGWIDYYFQNLKSYFAGVGEPARKRATAKKPAVKKP
ncbi:MAG TPA: hypothetical protein DFS52_00385, partial [Myxococcales bacterium]|nr:hypothetical protein [Myxococcales bacterium]